MKNNITDEEIKEILERIGENIITITNSEKYKEYLNFHCKNYLHSINNIILANIEFRELQLSRNIIDVKSVGLFKGEMQWKEIGRTIITGETPLKIFSPIIKKYLARTAKVPYINYDKLTFAQIINLRAIPRDIIYADNGNYIYMLEVISIDGSEKQGRLRALSKKPLDVKKVYDLTGKISLYKGTKQLVIGTIDLVGDINIKEKSKISGFKLTDVYSEHQTEGKDIPRICKRIEGESEKALDLERKVLSLIDIEVTYLPCDSNGYYYPAKKIININPQLLYSNYETQRVKTLIHEYVHYQVHVKDLKKKIEYIANKTNTTLYALEELVAESVAYMICNIHDIDTSSYSFEYLASWSTGDAKLLKELYEVVHSLYVFTIKDILEKDSIQENII